MKSINFKSAAAILGLLFFTGCQFDGFAQITLNTNDLPKVNTTIIHGIDQSSQIAMPGSGAQQMWDYTGLGKDTEDTMQIFEPSATPLGNVIKGANMVIKQGRDYQYLRVDNNASAMFILGSATDTVGLNQGPTPIFDLTQTVYRFTNPLTIVQCPASYGSKTSGFTTAHFATFAYDSSLIINGSVFDADSMKMMVEIALENDFNGWGTLRLPVQQSMDALMVRSTMTYGFKFYALVTDKNGSKQWMHVKTLDSEASQTSLQFFAKNRAMPVLELDLSEDGTQVMQATYQLSSPLMPLPKHQEVLNFEIFPNPAADYVKINNRNSEQSSIKIVDSKGAVVFEQADVANQEEISLKGLQPGMYQVSVSNERATSSKRLVIQ